MTSKIKRYHPSLFEKIENSNATVSELRVPIFSPLEKVSHNSKIAQEFKKNKGIKTIITAWGQCTTRGRALLGQQHKDILDCIYLNATSYEHMVSGSVRVYFSRRKVLISYFGNESGKTNQTWLKNKLEEIRDTVIEFKKSNGDSFDFNIIKHLDYIETMQTYCIELDERYVNFYSKDLSINYKKLLPSILAIKNAVIKTIVRFLLSHTSIRISLEKTLLTIGYPFNELNDANRRIFKKELIKYMPILKENFSIEYDGACFFYTKRDEIIFIANTDKEQVLSINDLVGKSITRVFFDDNQSITATLSSIDQKDGNYYVNLLFPDSRILQINQAFPSLNAIEKILD